MKIKIKDFIFCDDIRTEEGRKFSIIGTYSDKLKIIPKVVGAVTFRIPISTFIRFEQIDNPEKQSFTFKIDVTFEKTSVASIDGILNFNEERYLNFPLTRLEFEFDKSGTLNFKILAKDMAGNAVLSHDESLSILIENAVPSK